MTFPGVPSIYYGDEIGLGTQIDSSRQCMLWERSLWDQELFGFYQTLVKLRRSSSALIEGGFQIFFSDEDSFTYLRDADTECILVFAHRGTRAITNLRLPLVNTGIANGHEFVELISGQRLKVEGGYLPIGNQSTGIGIWVRN